MWQLTNGRRIRMGMTRTIFVVVANLFIFIKLNDAASSNSQFLTASSFVSIASPSTSTSGQSSSILNATVTTAGGISTTRILSTFASTASTASQAPSSAASLVSPSASSSLKTNNSILFISGTRTLNQTLHSSASHQTITNGVISTSSSVFFLNFSSRTLSAFSSLFSYISSSNIIDEPRTSHVLSPSLQTSVSEGSQSVLPSLSSKSINNTTIYGSSTGLHSQSLSATLVPQSSSVKNSTLSSSYSVPSSFTTVSSNASKVNNSSALVVSVTILPSASAKSNGTISMMQTTSEALMATENSMATTVLTSKAVVSPAVTHSSGSVVLSPVQDTSSIANSTLSPSAVLSSVGLDVNKTIVVPTMSVLLPSSEVLHQNQTVSTVRTLELPSINVTPTLYATPFAIGSSSMDTVAGSSIIYNNSGSSGMLTRSVTLSPSLVESQNSTSKSSRSILVDTSSRTVLLSTSAIVIVSSSAGANGTSTSVTSAMSQNTTVQSFLSSTSVSFHESAAFLSSVSDAVVSSSMVMATVKISSSKLLASRSLMVSPKVTSQPILSSRLTLSSKQTLSSSQISLSSAVSPSKTSTDDGFIVMSYSTPCYVYYVVEKTTFPVMTANHSVIPVTTPKVTLDIGSVSSMQSGLPTVTLTHSITMATKVSEIGTQVFVTSDASLHSTRSVGGSSSNSIAPTLVSLSSSAKATMTPSQPLILPSETVSKVLSTDGHSATDSYFGSSTILPDLASAASESKAATVSTQLKPRLSQQQTGTFFISLVSPVTELLNASTTHDTHGFSHMASSSRFSPFVATPSISDKQNRSIAAATSSSLPSVELTTKQSSVQSTAFITTISAPAPSQTHSFVTMSNAVSPVMSNDSTTVIQTTEGSALPSRSLPTETLQMSIPTDVLSGSKEVVASSGSQLLIATPSSTSSTQSQNASVLRTLESLVVNTSVMTEALRTVATSSSLFATVNQFEMSSSNIQVVLPVDSSSKVKTSNTGATKVSSSSIKIVTSSMSFHVSASSASRTGGQVSPVIPTSSTFASHMGPSSTSFSGLQQIDASSSLLLSDSQAFASSTVAQQSGVVSSSSANVSHVAAVSSIPHSSNKSSTSSMVVGLSSSVTPTTHSSASGQLASLSPSSSGATSQIGAASSPQEVVTSSSSLAANTSSAINITSSSSSSVSQSSTVALFSPPAKRRRKKRAVDAASNSSFTVIPTHNLTSGTPQLSYIPTVSTAAVTSSVAITVESASPLSSSGLTSISPTSSVTNQSGSLMQTSFVGKSRGFAPSSLPSSSGQLLISSESPSSQSSSQDTRSSQQPVASSQQQGNVTQTVVPLSSLGPSGSVSVQTVPITTQSASSSNHSSTPGVDSHASATTQIPSSVPTSASVTPVGTILSSLSIDSPTQSSAAVKSETTSGAMSVTNVVSTPRSSLILHSNAASLTPNLQSAVVASSGSLGEYSSLVTLIRFSTSADSGTVPSESSAKSSVVDGNGSSTSMSILSSRNNSLAGVATSSHAGGNATLPLVSSRDLMTSSVVLDLSGAIQSTLYTPSSKQTSSVRMSFSSAVVDSKTLHSTLAEALGTSFAILASSSIGSSSEQVSSTSSMVLRSAVPSETIYTTMATNSKQASAAFSNTSVTTSSSLSFSFEVIIPSPSSSSFRRDLSTQQAPLSSVVILAPSFSTKTVGSSSLANGSVASATLQGSVVSTPRLPSSTTTDRASQTLQQTFSSSRIMQRSSSAIQSEVYPSAFSSSVTVSNSVVYRPPLVTISSLGICYVVYTTRLIQPTVETTPRVNMSSTASVSFTRTENVSFVPVLPSVSLNTSSVVLQPTLTVNISSTESLTVNATETPSESSSVILSLSVTASTINASTSSPSPSEVSVTRNISSSISLSTSSSGASLFPTSTSVLPLPTSTSVLSKEPSSSSTEVSSSVEAPISPSVSPTGTVSQAVSSSVPVPSTPRPDYSLLLQTTLTVPQSTDIQSQQFKNRLEDDLVTAYRFTEATVSRRKRAVTTTATVYSIQRLNGSDVQVIFHVTKNGQGVPASQAAANYNKLTKIQLSRLLKLDVVSMPEPLVKPTTPPFTANYLVSVIIKNSAASNVSSKVNRLKLELNLASYYREKKQLPASTTVSATIHTILYEPNDRVYLEFFILVDGKRINRNVVVETFKVPHVNLLTAQLGVQVLVPVYIPETLTATEFDHVIMGLSINQNQDLNNTALRSELANKLITLYEEAKGRKTARRKRRSGSTSATIVDIVRNANTEVSEADVTFFVMDSGTVANATYVASIMNRLSTNEMTTFTVPYAVLTAPRPLLVPTTPTEVIPTEDSPIKWWIIPAVIGPILLFIVIILLLCWRWKKGAPKTKVEPDTIRMLETNRRRTPPVHGFDVARYTEPGVTGMRTTKFTSGRDEEEESEKPAKRGRETSLRRKVRKPPAQKLPIREPVRLTNSAYQEDEEKEEDESVTSVTPTGSTVGLLRSKATTKPPTAAKRTPATPQSHQEPQVIQQPQGPEELSEDESEEESEVSEEESETEVEIVAPPEQLKHSAAQLPTVAVMSEASGPPRYPPVRFRSSVHPAPSLPPLDYKNTSLVGARAEPPSEDDRGRKKGKVTKRELEQRADLERQKNKQRLRDRKRDRASPSVPPERRAWDRAQHDFDDVLAEGEAAERVITGRSGKRRRRRPPSSSIATDEEGMPHLKSYRKLKSPKTTSSTTSSRDRGKKLGKSTESASNVSSDESEIDMQETRRRMHAMLDDAFALFGPHSAKKPTIEPEGQSPQPEGYPVPLARPTVIPRYVVGHPALPEPPPAHGRATEPTPGQRRRVQPTMPGYPTAMPQTPIGVPGYPGRSPVRPVVTRDPIVVWDPADRQRILNQRAPPPTYAYRDPSGQNLYITPVHQQRDDMGGLVWSPYAAEDGMDALYPDLAQASYPGALGTSPPKDASFLSQLQAAQPHDTILSSSPNGTLDQRGASLGQSPQPLIKSIKDELFRLSQGTTRKTPITEL